MYSKELENQASKFMSFVLRHKPQELNLILDENGWVTVTEFIEKANLAKNSTIKFDLGLIEYVVKNNDKQRFAFNEDHTKIRANQGHTVEVDLDLPFVEPPEFLYHGTATQNLSKIIMEGLKSMQRHDVHLSFDKKVARSVGIRYGVPVILEISTKKMFNDGFKFQCSKNNVWLTSKVPIEYIAVLSE